MSRNSTEIGRINQGSLDGELSRWVEQDKLAIEGHPKEAEFRRISEQAKATLGRMSLALTMPTGYQILELGAEQLKELYEKAVTLRSEIAQDRIRGSFGVAPGQSIESVLEPEIEHATEKLGSGFSGVINKDLKEMAQAFGVNPADTMQGNVPGNKFFMSFRGKTGVNFEQVDKAREKLTKLRAAGRTSPGLAVLADKFEVGLRQVEATDPMRAAHHQWYNETFAGKKIDTKPLRILGGLLGGMLTTLGIAQTAFSKDHALSPATVGWGLATMLFANPNLLSGNGSAPLNTITALGSPEIQDIVNAGFKGHFGKDALEELQQIRKNNGLALKNLQKSKDTITIASLGSLTESVNSPLLKILSKMPEEKRVLALRVFGKPMTDDEKKFTGQMLEARRV